MPVRPWQRNAAYFASQSTGTHGSLQISFS